MKYNWISMVILLMVISLQGYGQTGSGRLQDWGIPVAGEQVTLSYKPDGGPLEGKHNISGIIYMFNDYKWALDDIELKEKNGKWEGSYKLPASCAFIAVKFISSLNGQVVAADNNNDLGFVATTVNKKNVRLPGANLAWGIFRKPSANKAPQGYFDKFDISAQALEMWVKKEMEYHPKEISKYFDSYLEMLKLNHPDSFPKLALRNLNRFAKDPNLTEQGYTILWEGYAHMVKDTPKADSVQRVVMQKFPKGTMQRLNQYNQIYAMPLDEKKLLAFEAFLKAFPISQYRRDSINTQNFIYYNTYRQLASAYFASNQNEKLFALVPEMDFATLNEIYRWNIDRIFALSRLPLERIYPVSHVLIDQLVQKRHDHSYMEGMRYTPRQAYDFAVMQLDNKLSIHIRLLNKMGKYQEALPYFDYLSAKGRYSDAALNEVTVNILEHTGGEKKVLSVLEEGIKAGAATPVMMTKLKVLYEKRTGKTGGFDAYAEALKPVDEVKKTKDALKAKFIKQKVDDFELTDMDGKVVKSADWQGKIVVLDFWATWCYPCKMAFPGMQQLVDRYQNDPQTKVFFISTMEKKPSYKEEVRKYIQTSGYRFNVLYDKQNPADGQNDFVFKKLTATFNSSAIPRKVVIKDGYIRYTAEGYSGSPSQLLDELSYVIELLKAE